MEGRSSLCDIRALPGLPSGKKMQETHTHTDTQMRARAHAHIRAHRRESSFADIVVTFQGKTASFTASQTKAGCSPSSCIASFVMSVKCLEHTRGQFLWPVPRISSGHLHDVSFFLMILRVEPSAADKSFRVSHQVIRNLLQSRWSDL